VIRPNLKRKAGNVRGWVHRLRLALLSPLPDDWETTELTALRKMRRSLREHTLLVRELDDLAFSLLQRLKAPPRQSEAIIRAHLSLLTRVLQDMRSTVLLARSGYTMQGWSVAASAFEAAHTMGYIGEDATRAEAWWKHTDLAKTFCAAKAGVQGSYKYLEIGTKGKDRETAVEHEYSLYSRLCMAKHVNPIAERTRYIGKRAQSLRLIITPYASERRVREARLGLLLAIRSAVLALWVLHKAHFGVEDGFGQRIHDVAAKTAALLASWKDVDLEGAIST
jgi:hypothetical protein